MPLTESFQRSYDRNPAKVAIAFGERSWTYAECDRLTDNLARNLLADGAEPGERVALHLLNGPELALGYIGCLKAGCVAVPVNTRLKGREVDYILRHSGSACYLGEPELYAGIAASCPALGGLERRYLTAEATGRGIAPFTNLLRSPDHQISLPTLAPDHVAAIVYTSGTTAHPKGVVHTNETLAQLARAMRDVHLDEDQVVLIMSSMAHLIGFAMLFLSSYLNRATTVITRPFDFSSSLQAFARWRCTYTLALPVMLRALLDAQAAARHDVSSGRYFFGGGDCVTPVLQDAFQRSFAPICELYGLTEIAPASWNRPGEMRVGSIGRVSECVAFRLLDAGGSDVEPGTIGEIGIRGPHLMKGYWQNSEATAAAFHDGWFRTGDLARCDADGFYWFAGRKKEIIIRGGSNISPQEVEAVLYEHPSVAEAAVVGRPDSVWGEAVIAHVVLRSGQEIDATELISFARQRVADYKTPEVVVFHSELPKSATGKIQRRALREAACAVPTEV